MRHFSLTLAAVAALAASSLARRVPAADVPPISPSELRSATEVRSAMDDLDRWLGTGENGKRWREFLKADQLRAELAKDSAVDPKTLGDVLTLFSSQTPGLESPNFQRVRQALQTWFTDLSLSTPEALEKLILGSQGKYVPVSAAEVEASKGTVATALKGLNAFLGKGPNGDAWRNFLKLADLQSALEAGTATSPEVLKSVEQHLSGGETGLDAPQFDGLRKSVIAYQRLLEASANAKAGEQFDSRLETLAAKLEAVRNKPTNADYQQISTLLRELGYSGQAAPIVDAIHTKFRSPNFLAEIGAPIMSAGVDRDLDEVLPVSDDILGTSISGTGRTIGTVRLRLVPDTNRALLETVLNGNVYTNTVGQHDPVTIFSTGVTSIYGVKPVQMNASGMAGLPATAKAETHSKVNSLQVNRSRMTGMIENAAWQRIGENKSQAEAVASQHAQQKIIGRMDQQANTMIAKNNASMNDRFRKPLTRYGAYPELHFSTTPEYLSVVGTAAAEDQVAAPAAPPDLPSHDAAAVRIHETALNNLAVKCYGGRRITRNDLKSADAEQAHKRLREMFIMEEPADGKQESETEASDKEISFVFDKEKPVVITLADQTLSIFMRVTDLTVDGKLSGDWDITAQYTLEKTDTGLKATLKPEAGKQQPDVVPAGFDRKSGEKIPGDKFVYVRTLRRKFGEQLKPEFNLKYVVLPGEFSKAGKLLVSNLQCENGWLALSLKQETPAEPKAAPAEKSAE